MVGLETSVRFGGTEWSKYPIWIIRLQGPAKRITTAIQSGFHCQSLGGCSRHIQQYLSDCDYRVYRLRVDSLLWIHCRNNLAQ